MQIQRRAIQDYFTLNANNSFAYQKKAFFKSKYCNVADSSYFAISFPVGMDTQGVYFLLAPNEDEFYTL